MTIANRKTRKETASLLRNYVHSFASGQNEAMQDLALEVEEKLLQIESEQELDSKPTEEYLNRKIAEKQNRQAEEAQRKLKAAQEVVASDWAQILVAGGGRLTVEIFN